MKCYIVAGEASGDLHGSNLIKGLLAEAPSVQLRFWGGDLMASAAGAAGKLVRHYKEGAVMGITDIIGKAGRLLGNIRFCKRDILEWGPDVVILIDYPGFNMKVAEFCHGKGIRVFYYIAPKTWASREGRNRKLKKWVDKLYIVFPFEIPYFTEKGIPFIYKGNPLIDAVDSSPAVSQDRGAFFALHGIPDTRYVAVLAGSRKGEISRMMPVCMEMADRMHSMPEYSGWRFIVAGAPARSGEDYASFIAGREEYVSLIFGDTYGILRHAGSAVINSGTASLEAALIGTPQVVCWSSSALTVWAARHILHVLDNVRYISLGNLIVDRPVFRELIQEDFNCGEVLAETLRLNEDEPYRREMTGGYAEIRSALGGEGASRAIAASMLSELL